MNWLKRLHQIFSRKKKPAKIPKVAICVGHSRINDSGARSVGGVTEWAYNNQVAEDLKKKLKARAIASEVVNDYPFKSYSKSMRWLGEKTWGFDVAIELHFNSYSSSSAKGYEYLYYHKSKQGRLLAQCFRDAHAIGVPAQHNRGIKGITIGQRGFGFLSKTKPTSVICEPFFGSNPTEWVLFDGNEDQLADIYADALQKYFAS